MQRQNLGPPWRRQFGELLPHGGIFTPTPREEAYITSSAIIEKNFPVYAAPVPPPVETPPQAPPPVENPTGSAVPVQSNEPPRPATGWPPPEWPLRLEPGAYLTRYPEGQHADLARRLLDEKERG